MRQKDIGVHPQEGFVRSPLQFACVKGNIEAVQLLLEHGADLDAHGRVGAPLFLAAQRSNLTLTKLLLDHGADVTVKGSGAALHEAAVRRNLEMLELLLDWGADPEQHYSEKIKYPNLWCLNQGLRHSIFDDIFRRRGAKKRAVLVPFLLRYKPESSPSLPKLALIAAGRNGCPDDIQLIFLQLPNRTRGLVEGFGGIEGVIRTGRRRECSR